MRAVGEDSIVGGQQCGITVVEDDSSGKGSSVEGNSVGGEWGGQHGRTIVGEDGSVGGQKWGRTTVCEYGSGGG